MRASSPASWIAVLSLVAACTDDATTTTATPTTTGGAIGSSTTTTGTSEGQDTTTGTTAATTATSGGEDPTTSGTTVAGTTSGGVDDSTTGFDDSTSTGEPEEPLLPGCGDTPPADFDAVPSAPADGATIAGATTELAVTLSGQILADATAKFHLREVHELSDDDDFTIVIMPDTQNYTQFPGNFPQYQDQTKWVWEHRNTDRIVAVLHNGDVVQHGNQIELEWQRAQTAMTTLETEKPNFPDGIPYGIAVGNHDNGAHAHDNKPFGTGLFNKYFGVKRFEKRGYYGGHYGSKNDNNWIVVQAGNLEVVMVSLEYRGDLGQDPDVLQWARGVFKDHPHALGIVNSHHIVRADGGFSGEGKQIYEAMKTVDNVQLMTSGHIKEFRNRRTDNHKGHVIHSMLADYQDLIIGAEDCAGGCGYMRLWRFSPKKNQLKVETFSPTLNKSMTGPKEQFTLTVDLSAATGVFELKGSISGPGPALAFAAEGLKPGTSYEWYAVVNECGAKVKTPVQTFKVQ
ncbi:metallophosphoesterase [Nannocystis bainbridge]|uniref:Metallophosphoesterase n=1 Tax=Nannocystis bainbridge TaxID=2995303 RepID=A0ABT5DSK5_9BACT|nr:metallophosphoesterase [Nannocystis bainbridge]MDC0716617.1 metallophosphoesterase [Nannocystis bainbridge]